MTGCTSLDGHYVLVDDKWRLPDRTIAAHAEIDRAEPESATWVRLLPMGLVKLRDGRGPFRLDDEAHGERVIESTKRRLAGADMVVDFDHQTVFGGRSAGAAGWIKPDTLTVTAAGIYGRAEWTAAAAARLAAREYRYISPVFLPDASGAVAHLINAALTNSPAIDMDAVAASTDPHEQQETASMPLILSTTLMNSLRTGWNMQFNKGFNSASDGGLYRKIAMVTKSSTAQTAYAWMGQMPGMREWLGERRIKAAQAHGFTIENRKFESTVQVGRTEIEDDQLGMYDALFEEMGLEAGHHPTKLVMEVMAKGFTDKCYDNQNFFDAAHPSWDAEGKETVESNVQEGDGPTWYLLDTTRAIKPFIYQERVPPTMVAMTAEDDPHVFMHDQYVYGVRARSNGGFGLWQLAAASKAALNAANFEALRTLMRKRRGDSGHLLGIDPTMVVVPLDLEVTAKNLFDKATLAGGESNIYYKAAEYVASPWIG